MGRHINMVRSELRERRRDAETRWSRGVMVMSAVVSVVWLAAIMVLHAR